MNGMTMGRMWRVNRTLQVVRMIQCSDLWARSIRGRSAVVASLIMCLCIAATGCADISGSQQAPVSSSGGLDAGVTRNAGLHSRTWIPVAPIGSPMRVDFPSQPTDFEHTSLVDGYEITEHHLSLLLDDVHYSAMWTDLPGKQSGVWSQATASEATEIMEAMMGAVLDKVTGTRVIKEPFLLDGRQALDFEFSFVGPSGEDGLVAGRYAFVNGTILNALIMGKRGQLQREVIDRFRHSLALRVKDDRAADSQGMSSASYPDADTGFVPGTKFATLSLPYGVSIEAPKNWKLISGDIESTIQTAAEASTRLTGLPWDGSKRTLIRANSTPSSTYAGLSVHVSDLSLEPGDLDAMKELTESELRSLLFLSLGQNDSGFSEVAGWAMEDVLMARVGKVSGYPSLEYQYRRTGMKGPVLVTQVRTYFEDKEISVWLSYRESEAILWKGMTAYMRESLSIQDSPELHRPLSGFGVFGGIEGGARVEFPSTYETESRELELPGGLVRFSEASCELSGFRFSAFHARYEDEAVLAMPVRDRLRGAVHGGVDGAGAELSKLDWIQLGGVEAARFSATLESPGGGDPVRFEGVALVDGPDLLNASVMFDASRADSAVVTSFLMSARIL